MKMHESSDANARDLAKYGGGLLVLLVAALAAMSVLFRYLAVQPDPNAGTATMAESRELPPEPRLQVTPTPDLERVLKSGDSVLASYGWVDRKAGIVRIPIERAMDLMAARGQGRGKR